MRPNFYRRVGLINAPFPATSHTDTRAHFQSFASVFQVNVWLPNGLVSVSGKVCVKFWLPSLHTISPNANGKVHWTSALTTIELGDAVETSTLGSSTSPMEM